MPKIQFNQLKSVLRRLIHFRPHGIRWRSFENYIKRLSFISRAGFASSVALFIISLLIIFPVYYKTNLAEAAGSLSDTTLSITSDNLAAGVDLLVTSDSGTFTSSTSPMSFSVTTNNVTGYMLSISAKSGTDLTNSIAGTSFTSLNAANGIDATTFDTTTYNNMWGFKPNYYKSAVNSDKFYPSPTTSGVTLNKTDSANTSGLSDTYTIAIGARATYSQVAGTYSNTYILNAVGNYPTYSITYNANTTDSTLANMPSPNPQVPDSDDIVGSTINLSSATPTRMGYKFLGWCSVNNSADPTTCSSTTYQPGASYALYTTSANSTTLYAMWTELTAMQNLDASICTTTATEVYDNRDGTIYNIQRLADGSCWLLDNLALDLTNADVQSRLNSSTTNATDTDINYLVNGGGATSDQYAIARVSDDWNDSYSYSAPLIATSGANWSVTTIADWAMKVESIDGKTGGKVGAYYNYCAASAGTYCYGNGTDYGTSTGNVTADICPSGWRMPTGGSNGEYQALRDKYSDDKTFAVAFRLQLSGYFVNSLAGGRDTDGFFWSSTRSNNYAAYFLVAHLTGIDLTSDNGRGGGLSVRCILKDIASAGYLQNVTQEMVDGMAVGDEVMLKDIRDNQDYTVAKLADGRLWMTKNLNLAGGTALYSDTSDVPGGYPSSGEIAYYTLPESSASFMYDAASAVYNSGSTECGEGSPCYSYYSWPVATAGSSSEVSADKIDASYSICPAGWKLPTTRISSDNFKQESDFYKFAVAYGMSPEASGEVATAETFYNNVNGGNAAGKAPVYLVLSGRYNGGTFYAGGETGLYWSRTMSATNSKAMALQLSYIVSDSDYTVRTNFGSGDWQGYSVRCILANPSDYLQNATQASMTAKMPNVGDTATLWDSRDNTAYTVGHLADGNYWLLDNLAFDAYTYRDRITTENTNVDAASIQSFLSGNRAAGDQYALSGISSTWESSYSYSQPLIATSGSGWDAGTTASYAAGVSGSGKVGVYYNYCAASAGSYCYGDGTSGGTSTGNAMYDMCPAGWRLPTGGTNGEYQTLYGAYESSDSNFASELQVVLAGSYNNGAVNFRDGSGYYWSSTRTGGSGSGGIYNMMGDTSAINTAYGLTRYVGFSVRCVLKSTTETELGIQYMQDFKSSDKSTIMAKMETDKQYQLIDSRDGKKYYVAKLQDGNIWMTQNLDYAITSTDVINGLTSETTDLTSYGSGAYTSSQGYSSSNGIITWKPTRATIDATNVTNNSISGWSNDNNTPYSVDPGDWYWIGNPFYASATCLYLNGCTDKFTKTMGTSTNNEHGHVGNYYNWSTAVASNNTSSLTSSTVSNPSNNPQNSICPAGWRLPTVSNVSHTASGSTNEFGRLNYLYNSGSTSTNQNLEKPPLYFVRAGSVGSNALYYSGYYGIYWSSTVSSNNYVYGLTSRTDLVVTASPQIERFVGFSMRCVSR